MTNFLKNTLKLFLSKVGASLILALLFPILSRFFEPSEIGVQTLYISLVQLLIPIACLRLDMALVVVKDENYAKHLLILSLMVSAAITSVLWLTLIQLMPLIKVFSGFHSTSLIATLLALNFFIEGLFLVLTSYVTRRQRLSYIAIADLSRAVVLMGYPIAVVFFSKPDQLTLLVAYFLSSLIAVLILSPMLLEAISTRTKMSISSLKMLREQGDFLTYGNLGSFFNGLSLQLPLIMIGAIFGKEILGYVGAAIRFLSLPAKTIGAAVSRSFFAETKDFSSGSEYLHAARRNISYVAIGVSPLIILTPVSHMFFEFILGANWAKTGQYFNLLLALYILWTITSPLSSIFSTLRKQRLLCGFQLFKFLVRVGSLYISSLIIGVSETILIYSVCSALVYYFQSERAYILVGGSRADFFILLGKLFFLPVLLAILFSSLNTGFSKHEFFALVFVGMVVVLVSQLLVLRNNLNGLSSIR